MNLAWVMRSGRSGFEHPRRINRDYPSDSKTPTRPSCYPPSHRSHRFGAAKTTGVPQTASRAKGDSAGSRCRINPGHVPAFRLYDLGA